MKSYRTTAALALLVILVFATVGCDSGQTTQADIENQVTEIQKQDTGAPDIHPGDDMIMMGSGKGGAAQSEQPAQQAQPETAPQ